MRKNIYKLERKTSYTDNKLTSDIIHIDQYSANGKHYEDYLNVAKVDIPALIELLKKYE